MKIQFIALSIPMLLASNLVLAQDVTDELPLQTRDQIRQEMQNMTPEERALYREMNADQLRAGDGQRQNRKGEGKGKGEMKRLRDGSGNGGANRSEYRQRSEQRSSYGSGFGSRMGGGGGHGRR